MARIRTIKPPEVGKEGVRPGFIYVIGCAEGYYKIGRCRYINQRVKQLRIQLPFKIELVHMLFVSFPAYEERCIHEFFRERRVNGEWFRLDEKDLEYIAKVLVFQSDMRLILEYRRFHNYGNTQALAGVVDLYNRLPNHLLPVDIAVSTSSGEAVQ